MSNLTKKSKRMTKTVVELTIGIVGILAIMIAQLGDRETSKGMMDKISSSSPAKLVYLLSDDSTTDGSLSNNVISPVK